MIGRASNRGGARFPHSVDHRNSQCAQLWGPSRRLLCAGRTVLPKLSLPRHIDMFVEYLEAGMRLPEMPIFLDAKHYVNVPLESAYESARKGAPAFWRDVVLGKPAR